jgi:hypothetical protein
VAEGGGLLNRYTAQSRIEGSNPSVSATQDFEVSAPAHSLEKLTLWMDRAADGCKVAALLPPQAACGPGAGSLYVSM